jgi:hypothetical protein
MRSFAGIAAPDLSINENGRDASPLGKSDDAHFQQRFWSAMLCIQSPVVAQGELGDAARGALSGREALEMARERFPNLCCAGILPRKAIGEPVDLADVEIALAALAQCRKTRTRGMGMHTFDMRMLIDAQHGALIAAAVALGFDVYSWRGTRTYAPHALIAVNQSDVRRVAAK